MKLKLRIKKPVAKQDGPFIPGETIFGPPTAVDKSSAAMHRALADGAKGGIAYDSKTKLWFLKPERATLRLKRK